jgi:hypothetical protein
MATVKVKTVGTKKPLRPKVRPTNLAKQNAVKDGVGVPELASANAKDVFKWAETLRDTYQEAGELLTPLGLKAHAEKYIPEDSRKTVLGILKNIYVPKPGSNGATTPAPRGGAAKAAAKTAAKAKARAAKEEAVPVKVNNKTKIPVSWFRSPGSERNRARIFSNREDGGYPLQAFVRALGKKGWENAEAEALLTKMGLGDYHTDMKHHVIGAHMAAGRAKGNGANGKPKALIYGPIPTLTADEWKALAPYQKA